MHSIESSKSNKNETVWGWQLIYKTPFQITVVGRFCHNWYGLLQLQDFSSANCNHHIRIFIGTFDCIICLFFHGNTKGIILIYCVHFAKDRFPGALRFKIYILRFRLVWGRWLTDFGDFRFKFGVDFCFWYLTWLVFLGSYPSASTVPRLLATVRWTLVDGPAELAIYPCFSGRKITNWHPKNQQLQPKIKDIV